MKRIDLKKKKKNFSNFVFAVEHLSQWWAIMCAMIGLVIFDFFFFFLFIFVIYKVLDDARSHLRTGGAVARRICYLRLFRDVGGPML